ncbi:molecular chaperone [Klebsiella sp. BIGb0407]|uniref:fimbrial biogenesis chaperone n=1 Tax=Klebsiella sp. BIGb0407 TaxID=2940603 RepID=UPI0021675644|nr:fimbria/pilus periplasmic chaperone [Klebsiella sp. BIGb0407]MCS3431271.1 P pilus assembly chaperone PapD [Klebsiella sp. BIGb0407]
MTNSLTPTGKFSLLIILILLTIGQPSYASIVVQSTRVIYPANKQYVSVQLVNNNGTPSLVQSWIDGGDIDSTPETTTAPFIVTPPITKISAYDGTQLKVHFLERALPQDRESVYYFNILDIPAKSDNDQGVNQLKLTVQTRIKLFYRPVKLLSGVEKSLNEITFSASTRSVIINNPTPYFMTIADISLKNDELLAQSVMLEPFSKQDVSINREPSAGWMIDVDFIGDSGDYTRVSKKVL